MEEMTENHSRSSSVSSIEKKFDSEEPKDYIELYGSDSEAFPPPPPPAVHLYDFEQESTTSSSGGQELHQEDKPKSLASMGDLVVGEVEKLSMQERKPQPEQPTTTLYNGTNATDDASSAERPAPKIVLFIKAGSDRECIGCCPFSQRLFMMLWLKGVVFNVTTVDKATKPKQLKDIAAGTNPPFLLFNGEELTDIQKCEDYIEAELYPPRYPKLACKHAQSNTVGNDVFAKFSAFVKFTGNKSDPKRKMLETKLNDALRKLDKYLNEPLDDEIDEDDDSDEPQHSRRKFIDGNNMTIADCNMLPKLNMIRVAGKEMLSYEIPGEFTGIARYLQAADQMEEFVQTCPEPGEIIWTYGGRKPRPGGWKK